MGAIRWKLWEWPQQLNNKEKKKKGAKNRQGLIKDVSPDCLDKAFVCLRSLELILSISVNDKHLGKSIIRVERKIIQASFIMQKTEEASIRSPPLSFALSLTTCWCHANSKQEFPCSTCCTVFSIMDRERSLCAMLLLVRACFVFSLHVLFAS